MILEALVTTLNLNGSINIAPMGPLIHQDPDGSPSFARFTLRPFKTATTYLNLKAHPEGVLHVTDDVLLLAKTAIHRDVEAPTRPAQTVRGAVLTGACRYFEFRVADWNDSPDQPRATVDIETVTSGHLRDFFGLNRAKHAVVEAAILATRTEFLPLHQILDDYQKLAILIEKTGGLAEKTAFSMLVDHVRNAAKSQGLELPLSFEAIANR